MMTRKLSKGARLRKLGAPSFSLGRYNRSGGGSRVTWDEALSLGPCSVPGCGEPARGGCGDELLCDEHIWECLGRDGRWMVRAHFRDYGGKG